MPKPSDYILSDDDNAAIFEQQIRPAEFGRFGNSTDSTRHGTTDTGRPVCIILAGQTGAGKSHAAPALAVALNNAFGYSSINQSQNQNQNHCHLVADTHKPYHPAYAGLVADAAAGKSPPGLASAATGTDARRWLARACAVAASLKSPTLVESASRYPQDVVEMAGIFRQAGYHVCIVLLAVHPAQSRLGLLARFLDARESPAGTPTEAESGKKRLPVRLTPRPIHDESYAGLAELATLLDKDIIADQVLILRRGNQVAYSNCYGEGGNGWTRPPNTSQALAAERSRKDITGEAALFFSDIARLKAKHAERATELDGFAAEYEAAMAGGEEAPFDKLSLLDADALVARLRRQW